MTKPKRYKRYSSEFKREAILRASEGGNTDKAVCEELGISTRQFLGKSGTFYFYPTTTALDSAA